MVKAARVNLNLDLGDVMETEKLNLESFTANMYGCEPCPKCKDKFRYPMHGQIICGDCGYVSLIAKVDSPVGDEGTERG